MDVHDRHVVLTGATGGIGGPLAELLARRGARLTLVARSADALKELAAPSGAYPLVADLTDPDALASVTSEAEAANGDVDVLINNAGVETAGHLPAQSASEVAELLQLNLLAPVELSRQVLPGMLRRGRGHIVNVSSLAGVGTFPGLAAYGASKAGLSHFTSGLRADLRGGPIRTTLVEIGPVRTPMLDRVLGYPPTAAGFERLYSLRMLAELAPEPVARAIADALARNREHLRLPRRAAFTAAITELPRRMVSTALTGVAHRVVA